MKFYQSFLVVKIVLSSCHRARILSRPSRQPHFGIILRTSQENTTSQVLQLVSDAVQLQLHSFIWLHLLIRPTDQIMSFREFTQIMKCS